MKWNKKWYIFIRIGWLLLTCLNRAGKESIKTKSMIDFFQFFFFQKNWKKKRLKIPLYIGKPCRLSNRSQPWALFYCSINPWIWLSLSCPAPKMIWWHCTSGEKSMIDWKLRHLIKWVQFSSFKTLGSKNHYHFFRF